MKVSLSGLKMSTFSDSVYSHEPSKDLIDSIAVNGVLQAIWISPDNTIISGHRRVNACKALGIEEVEVEVRDYSDLLVIEANRYREKTWKEKLREADEMEKILRVKARIRQSDAGKIKGRMDEVRKGIHVIGDIQELPKNSAEAVETRIGVANALNTSHDTLHKVKVIAKEKPELLDAIDAGNKSVHSAYNQIQVAKQREERKHNQALSLPEGKYRTIVIDPPWPVDKILRDERPNQGEFGYPTMTIEEIKAFPLQDIINRVGVTGCSMVTAMMLKRTLRSGG